MKRPGGFDGGSADDRVTDRAPAEIREARAPREPIHLPQWRRSRSGARATEESIKKDKGQPESADRTVPSHDAPTRDAAPVPGAPPESSELGRLDSKDLRPPAPDDAVRVAANELKRAQRSVRRRERSEQRRFTAHLRKRRRAWLMVGGAIVALALFVAVGAFSPLTAVQEVRVVGATQVNEEDIQTALSRFDGVPLTLVRDEDVHRALEPFPLIERYSIERIPPHTLIVRIEERDAVVAVDRDNVLHLLDPAGVLIGTAEERPVGVPVASGQVAVESSPAFSAASRVIRDLPPDIREQIAEVHASSAQDVGFILTTGTRVIWGEAVETQKKALVLRSILASVGAVSNVDVSSPNAPVFQ